MEKFILDKIEEITFTEVSQTDSLWEGKVLDSISIVELVVELEKEYNIKVPFNEIVTENFETVERIVTYLKSKIG
jgi:D-alanine--poly(phosphoribitol) ligase subunit 2